MKYFVYGLLIISLIAACSGCTSFALEYEHVSHPFAGKPFNNNPEDWIDQINVCGNRDYALSESSSAYATTCAGYSLTDGGFYGPELTGTIRLGIRYNLDKRNIPTHNALGGYIPACGDKPGMVGDDC